MTYEFLHEALHPELPMPKLSRITIFPIKSLDGRDVSAARVLSGGALGHDRRWAMIDEYSNLVTAKGNAQVHSVRAEFAEDFAKVRLRHGANRAEFWLESQREAAAKWCSQVFGFPCRIVENSDGGFPDDEDAPGPTLISTSSLGAVASWYDNMTVADARRRLRTNLEIDDCEAFWEDTTVGGRSENLRLEIGDAVFRGRRICQRCVVPSRDPKTGEIISRFAKTFAKFREETLPAASPRGQFDHFYRIAINTSLVSRQNEGTIRVGDEVRLVD